MFFSFLALICLRFWFARTEELLHTLLLCLILLFFCFVCFQQLSVFPNSLCSSCMREFMMHLNMNVVQFL